MPIEPIFLITILVMSVVLHEVSHGWAAYLLGDPTAKLAGRLTLNPFKHLDLVGSFIVPAILILLGGFVFGWAKPVPYNPYNLRAGRWGPAYVAAAGPGANLLVALVFGLLLRLAPIVGPAAALISLVVLLNVMLAIFNLLPVPPLDGSKLLFALIPYRWRRLEEWLVRYQLVLLLGLILLIANSNLLSRLVGFVFRLFTGGSL